jgi:hypothetical protein
MVLEFTLTDHPAEMIGAEPRQSCRSLKGEEDVVGLPEGGLQLVGAPFQCLGLARRPVVSEGDSLLPPASHQSYSHATWPGSLLGSESATSSAVKSRSPVWRSAFTLPPVGP